MATDAKPGKKRKADDRELSNFQKLFEAAKEANAGKPMLTKAAALNTLIGLPSPSLAFSWLMQCNVLPFSRVAMLVGKYGSCKSALLADLMRQVLDLHGPQPIPGSAIYVENENKPTLGLYWAVLENRPELDGKINVEKTTWMEAWQQAIAVKVKEWDGLYDPGGKQKFGWQVPLFVGLDSLTATSCLEVINAIEEEGNATKGFPADANLLSRYAKSLPKLLGAKPILYVTTNHLKEFADPKSKIVERKVPGGDAFKFMESVELELSRGKAINTNNKKGMIIRINAFKNCVGESRRSIEVPFVWAYDVDEEGQPRQWAMWDWYGASINLIKAIKAKDKARWDRVNEVVDIHDGRNDNLVWSNTLGVPSSGQVTPHELGCRLEENPHLLDALYPILNVTPGRFFSLGMDYRAMMADEFAKPDPQSTRTFRRPVCGELSRQLASGELDLSGTVNLAGGFVEEAA